MAQIVFLNFASNHSRAGHRETVRLYVPASVARIIEAAAKQHGVDVAVMMGNRAPEVVAARREAMRKVRETVTVSGRPANWSEIGRWFGRRDTTIMEACGVIPRSELRRRCLG